MQICDLEVLPSAEQGTGGEAQGDTAAALPEELPLVSRELCSLKHGRTEKVETKGWHLNTHFVLHQQQICTSRELSSAATLLPNS